MTGKLIVGFHSVNESIGALRWAIDHARHTERRLVVAHASTTPITVYDGPSAAVAHKLGNPTWASVYSIARGFGGMDDVCSRVEPGDPAEVLAAHAARADLVVLGPRRRGWFRANTQEDLERRVDCPVVRIDDRNWRQPMRERPDDTATLLSL